MTTPVTTQDPGLSRLERFKLQYPHTEGTLLSGADLAVVAVYFVVIICIGVFAMMRSNRNTVGGFFLAGRSMWFLPIGASLFVSNIGTEHFIGLSGSGASNGIAVGAWEFNAILLLQLLGWIFIPVYIACGTFTMPEYLTKRFGSQRLRVYFAILSLILYIFTKCSGDLYTGALFIQQSLKWNLYLCIFILVVITGFMTMAGGLTAVIYTDTMQAFLMVGGGLLLMALSFKEVGGYDGMVRQYPNATTSEMYRDANTSCHKTDPQAFKMLRSADDDYMPWAGFLFGQTPGSIWYWCADQVIVQRLLAAKSVSHAQGATLMAGFIKILPLFMMVMPGMIARILYADEVACIDPEICNYVCQSNSGCTSIAYPRLVLGIMPEGLRGLMMAVMIAALMSDLDSIFNSASTLFTVDIYQRVRKGASQRELMFVGRIFILVMVGVSIAWVPILKEMQGNQVFIYIQEITDYLAPPFAAVFLIGILVPRVNEKGAFWSLMIAFMIGVVRMVLVFTHHDAGGCEKEDTRPAILKNFHYMYFSLFITLLTAALAVIISLFTEKPHPKLLNRTTYWTRHDDLYVEDTPGDRGFTNIAVTDDDGKVFTVENNGRNADNNELKVFRDPKLDNPEGPDNTESTSFEDHGCKQKTLNYLCGATTIDHASEEKLKQHMEEVAALHQTKTEKRILTVGLVFILAIGVFLYVFWSVWEYQPN